MTTESFQPAAPEPDPLPETERLSLSPPAGVGRISGSSRLLVNGVLVVAFVVLVGGIGFAAGRATASEGIGGSTLAGARSGFDDQNGPRANGGPAPVAPNGGAPNGAAPNVGFAPGVNAGGGDDIGPRFGFGGLSLQGKVSAVTANSITITLPDGRTATIATNASTGYHRQGSASSSDVTSGSTVIVSVTGVRRDGQGGAPTAGSITIVP
jgi:hypothetical protein